MINNVTVICYLPVAGFYLRLSECLTVFLHDISKTDAARITKLDIRWLVGWLVGWLDDQHPFSAQK